MTKSVTDLFKVGLVLFFTLLAQGCKKEDITAYEVNRLDPPERTSSTNEPVRLLAAIFSKGDSTWFFKLMGPASKLTTKTEEFETAKTPLVVVELVDQESAQKFLKKG